MARRQIGRLGVARSNLLRLLVVAVILGAIWASVLRVIPMEDKQIPSPAIVHKVRISSNAPRTF
jgi:hypothetical protein